MSVAQAQPAPPSDSAYVASHYAKRELSIPVRDGVHLYAVAYVPRDASPTHRYPIVLQRTPFSVAPYALDAYPRSIGPNALLERDGYIFVSEEVRGRYRSEGTFENVRPLRSDGGVDESTDAFDTIEWLLHNVPEQNGRVGLYGVSYGGYYAAAAALSRHPAIAATVLEAPVMDFYFEDFHHNGAFLEVSLGATPIFGTRRPGPVSTHWWLPPYLRIAELVEGDDYGALLALGALRNATARLLPDDAWWRAIVAHPDYDAFWRARAMPPKLRGVSHPVLVVGGWYDAENLYGTLAAYRALRTLSPAASVTLAMGPYRHRGWIGDDATEFQRDVEAPFFRAHVARSAPAASPGASMFDTGRGTWTRFSTWPAPDAPRRRFFLRADGALADAPDAGRAFAEFVSDPRKPVPARCTGPTIEDGVLDHVMTDDQRCFTMRPDVAVFATSALDADVTLAGPLAARLSVSTTGTDADFVVKLVDVDSGGSQRLVRGEIMRGRYRTSFSAPRPFVPDAITSVGVDLPDVFHTFRKGHRIMVQVQSTWFPLFDRNPQRFVPNIYEARDRDFQRATQRIWTGARASSRIDALVLPNGSR